MKLAIEATIFVIALGFLNSEAGTLSSTFLSSFAKDGEKKDAIFEFNPVLDNILRNPAVSSLQGDERRTKIVSLLQQQTKAMQLPVLNALASMGLKDKATPFWVANKIAVKDVPLSSLKILSAIPGPFTVREAQTVKAFPINSGPVFNMQPSSNNNKDKRQTEYQWGVDKIGAPAAIAAGITGAGSVVGVIDTGARVTHVALKNNYRGGPYSWRDAVNNNATPYDDNGHGTHCMGTAVGTEYGIGVAPGAKWIACKALDFEGGGSEVELTECGQFMACPNNSTGNCTDYPNVVSNSWGGGQNNAFYNSVIKSWRALNIVPVFAIGNSGPFCGTANSPGDQADLISVGSIDTTDEISEFSSRGTGGTIFDRIFKKGPKKPEVAAPGRDIISADCSSDTGYRSLSGTSMATPHVAGAIALLLSSQKGLTFEEVKKILESTAVPHEPEDCQRFFDTSKQNNEYGYGRISIPKALKLAS